MIQGEGQRRACKIYNKSQKTPRADPSLERAVGVLGKNTLFFDSHEFIGLP